MGGIIPIRTEHLGEGEVGSAPADKILEGQPITRSWEQDVIPGRVRSGVWEMTPGVHRSVKGNVYEYCHLLAGVIELTEDGGEPQRYVAGDKFVMKPGFSGTWRTIETVRKVYVIVD